MFSKPKAVLDGKASGALLRRVKGTNPQRIRMEEAGAGSAPRSPALGDRHRRRRGDRRRRYAGRLWDQLWAGGLLGARGQTARVGGVLEGRRVTATGRGAGARRLLARRLWAQPCRRWVRSGFVVGAVETGLNLAEAVVGGSRGGDDRREKLVLGPNGSRTGMVTPAQPGFTWMGLGPQPAHDVFIDEIIRRWRQSTSRGLRGMSRGRGHGATACDSPAVPRRGPVLIRTGRRSVQAWPASRWGLRDTACIAGAGREALYEQTWRRARR